MILEIDAGNTFTKWRLRRGEALLASGRWPTREFDAAKLRDCDRAPRQVLVASVAGERFEQTLLQAVASAWGVPVRFARTQAAAAGVRNSYADPARMGVDRWLAMLAAWQRCGEPCCVVDCGSAITIDLLGAEGEHRGGYILPGLRMMRQVLGTATAGVLIEREIERFDLEPGCDTSSAVAHGTNLMFCSLAQRLPHWWERRQPGAPLLVTGGDGALFRELMGRGEYLPDLVLDGLRWALE
jgi:type III pantothenate kinase